MNRRIKLAMLFVTAFVFPALAENPPALPSSAKKLTGKEIIALYDGSTFHWHVFATGGTGTVTHDFTKKTNSGTWAAGDQKGTFTGKIRVKSDRFCYKIGKDKEVCDSVYTDGSDVYEVSSKGVVDALMTKGN